MTPKPDPTRAPGIHRHHSGYRVQVLLPHAAAEALAAEHDRVQDPPAAQLRRATLEMLNRRLPSGCDGCAHDDGERSMYTVCGAGVDAWPWRRQWLTDPLLHPDGRPTLCSHRLSAKGEK